MSSVQENCVDFKKTKTTGRLNHDEPTLSNPSSNYSKIKDTLTDRIIDSNLSGLEVRLVLGVFKYSHGYNQETTIDKISKQSDYLKLMPSIKESRHAKDSIRRAFKSLFSKEVLILISKKPFKCKINARLDEWSL